MKNQISHLIDNNLLNLCHFVNFLKIHKHLEISILSHSNFTAIQRSSKLEYLCLAINPLHIYDHRFLKWGSDQDFVLVSKNMVLNEQANNTNIKWPFNFSMQECKMYIVCQWNLTNDFLKSNDNCLIWQFLMFQTMHCMDPDRYSTAHKISY